MEINKSRCFVTVAVPPNPPEIKEELGVLEIDRNGQAVEVTVSLESESPVYEDCVYGNK